MYLISNREMLKKHNVMVMQFPLLMYITLKLFKLLSKQQQQCHPPLF